MMRATGRRLGSLLLLAPAWLAAQPAGSDLLEVDLDEPEDGLVTRDTTAGLDWLDPVLSSGLSFAEVEADVGGFFSDGWRHATGGEVCRLFDALGAAPTPCPGGEIPVEVDDISEHFRLLGLTPSRPLSENALRGVYEDGAAADRAGLAEIIFLSNIALIDGDLSIRDASISADEGRLSVGHLLVRPVPEPRAAWVVPVVLAVLSAVRHRWPGRLCSARSTPRRSRGSATERWVCSGGCSGATSAIYTGRAASREASRAPPTPTPPVHPRSTARPAASARSRPPPPRMIGAA